MGVYSDELQEQKMSETNQQATIDQAILKVMGILAKQGIAKDRKNDQQGYKFRGIDEVYNALAPALVEAGLIVIPSHKNRTCEERTSAKGTALFYVTVESTFEMRVGGESVVAGPFFGEAMDSGDKATNKAMSASYKYWAMQTFAIPTEGDNDADKTTHEVDAKRPNTAIQVAIDALNAFSPEKQAEIRKHADELVRLHGLRDGAGAVAYVEPLDTEERLALYGVLAPMAHVRSWVKDQQKIAGMNAAAKQMSRP